MQLTFLQALCLVILLAINITAQAKDFSTKGHTYEITDPPFLQMINTRLQAVDMQQERKKMKAIAKERIHNPKPLENITPAVKERVFFYDPTYVLDEDAVLPCGKILHKAGTTVNPLEHMELNRRLFFIDSREKKQVKWLKANLSSHHSEQGEPIEDKIILVGGSPLKLEEELGQPVYFDQQSALTNKFGIKHSPALLEQDGIKIRIQEVKIDG